MLAVAGDDVPGSGRADARWRHRRSDPRRRGLCQRRPHRPDRLGAVGGGLGGHGGGAGLGWNFGGGEGGGKACQTGGAGGGVSPKLADMAIGAAKGGVDWAALPAARSVDDISAAIRADAFAPLTATLSDLERLRAATDATTALHLLPLVDDAKDARSLATAAEALGPRLIGRAEVLGKARLFRTTLRVSETAWMLISGLSGLLMSIAALMGSALQSYLFRRLRRTAKGA